MELVNATQMTITRGQSFSCRREAFGREAYGTVFICLRDQ